MALASMVSCDVRNREWPRQAENHNSPTRLAGWLQLRAVAQLHIIAAGGEFHATDH